MTRTSCTKAGLGELKQAPDLVASSTICRWQQRDTRNGARHPRRPVVCPIPRWCPAILAEVIADVLNAAEYREQLAACAAVSAAWLQESLRASVRHADVGWRDLSRTTWGRGRNDPSGPVDLNP